LLSLAWTNALAYYGIIKNQYRLQEHILRLESIEGSTWVSSSLARKY
jgi:hypothetical protein